MSGAAQGMGLQKANKNGKKSCANIRKENDSVGFDSAQPPSTPLSHREKISKIWAIGIVQKLLLPDSVGDLTLRRKE